MTDAVETAPAPVVESPISAQAAPLETTPTPGAGAEGQAAPASAAPPAQVTPATSEAPPAETKPSTVLGGEAKTEQPASAQAEAPKQEEASPSDEPAPLPTYEPFTLPEGVTVDEARIGEFTKTLGEFESLTKADHAEVQKFGQSLMERHIAEVKNTVDRLNESYANAWEKQKSDWLDAFKSDPEIGGNRADTTATAALEFIRTHGGTEAQQAEFRKVMNDTGLGNHPAVIRMLANAMNANREGQPLPAAKPVTETRGKAKTLYAS